MPLKILFLSHVFAPGIGGIESYSQLLIDAFREAGHEIRLLTMQPGGPDDGSEFAIIRQPSLPTLLAQHRWADIVFENNLCLRLGWPKLLFGKPSIAILQTWVVPLDSQPTLSTQLKSIWLARTDRVIAISDAIRDVCWPKALLIGNSYDDKVFTSRAVKRNKDFVFIGRLVSEKGAQLAIRAFSSLLAANPASDIAKATLTIIGDGPDRPQLEALAASLLAPGQVRFVGVMKGAVLAEELSRHSYQFIPSRSEPFGIVALEGIACGLIPIASDSGGLPYAVGKAGITFSCGNLESLLEATNQLLHSPEQQQACLLAAPAHLAAFSPTRITRQLLDVVESVSPQK